MPTISQFFGIVIRMYYEEHGVPHFHAHYAEEAAVIAIDSLAVIEGQLSRRALALVLEWSFEHRSELNENWERARRHEPLLHIEPLR